MGEAKVNKSAMVREYAAANPTKTPAEIVFGLGEQGIVVSAGYVSSTLYTASRKASSKAGGESVAAVGPKRVRKPAVKAMPANQVTVSELVGAIAFVDRNFGGNIESAVAMVREVAAFVELVGGSNAAFAALDGAALVAAAVTVNVSRHDYAGDGDQLAVG